ncbi:MAG: DUF58 domain-containing protein [Chitinophagaceae bacterium]
MLTISEILKKVRSLEIKSKKLSANIFSGEYHSAFKGRGMSFKEVREYSAGDDIRFIDWNVSARFGHPFSKLFEEERELTVMLLIDVSASNLMGTRQRSKQHLITEIGAVLAFSAINNNDKVGAIFFSDQIEKYIPPKKGKEHVLYIVRTMLGIEPKSAKTNIALALKFFSHTVRQRSIAFLCTDFADEGFDKSLKIAALKHDLVCIRIYDRLEMQLPAAGLLPMQDAETGELVWMDSTDAYLRQFFTQQQVKAAEALQLKIEQSGADHIRFATDEDFVKPLQQFFIRRMK